LVDEKEEVNIKKMAGLLRSGATMLDLTCTRCENILFKLKDESIFCPSCEQEVIIQKSSEKNRKNSKNIEQQGVHSSAENVFSDEIRSIRVLIKKLCNQLENSEKINIIESQINLLEKVLHIYKELINLT
jgi:uncharacterized Zn finger protein (UPF0148 family)